MTSIAELRIADDPLAWQALGLDVDGGHATHLGHVRLQFDPHGDRRGIVGWTVAGAPDDSVTDVDGLPTTHGEAVSLPAHASSHLLGVEQIDHLVVTTPDLDRTVEALTRKLGLLLRRTRDTGTAERPMRQAFFRMGEVVLEVVGPRQPDAGSGPARFWGLALTVLSLPEALGFLGADLVGDAKPAVQPERDIATIRPAAGLAVPVALMGS
jgi:catechol 2,3-dioxygenase-like lactoylglutathione lyase family enzyme